MSNKTLLQIITRHHQNTLDFKDCNVNQLVWYIASSFRDAYLSCRRKTNMFTLSVSCGNVLTCIAFCLETAVCVSSGFLTTKSVNWELPVSLATPIAAVYGPGFRPRVCRTQLGDPVTAYMENLYSRTWGRGCEKKTIALRWAWWRVSPPKLSGLLTFVAIPQYLSTLSIFFKLYGWSDHFGSLTQVWGSVKYLLQKRSFSAFVV
jgi:hypothetical protein